MTISGQPWHIRGKHCLVTGATSGIGLAICAGLVRDGARVIAVARSDTAGAQLLDRVRRDTPDAAIDFLTADLSRMADVRALARAVGEVHGRLDVPFNNAAVAMFRRELTDDGLETTFAVNHLAPFLLTTELLSLLGEAQGARVITTTSDNHRGVKEIPWDDLRGDRDFRPLTAYNRTKLMNVWFTRTLAEKMAGSGIVASCWSPGFVRTNLARNARGPFAVFIRLSAAFQSTPQVGARTGLHLAASPVVSELNGGYFAKSARVPLTGLAADREQAHRLWEISASLLVSGSSS